MKDQAENLRIRVLQSSAQKHAKTLAVVSGKGGVGKSNFSLNFSILLSKKGKRVLLFDMDIGMGNINILLGNITQRTIVDFFQKEVSIQEVITKVSDNMSIICGGTGLSTFFTMSETDFERFVNEFSKIQNEYDYIIFDLGAGISKESSDFLKCVDEIVTITTPEPTSIMDAYSMIKYLHFLNEQLPVYIVCNRVQRNNQGRDTIIRLQNTVNRFLEKEIISLGSLPDSRVVLKAVTAQTPFTILNPKADISAALDQLTTSYLSNSFNEEKPVTKKSFLDKLQNFFIGR
ncbi:MinD/ParA family protein [Bacillus massiliigorillae]|uniref:MinD/ParA family protein n=1 Tax=Bacillus massiliigorillae TaxID=1243664 RepID=UPI0003A262E6|nr:MinD/ParA family protein [Bacillus massiliigorillae]